MTYRNSSTKHSILHSDINYDLYSHMCEMKSELQKMVLVHETYVRTQDMFSYHLRRAIEYCDRELREIEKRAKIDED